MRCYTLRDNTLSRGIETEGYTLYCQLPEVVLEAGITYEAPDGWGADITEMIRKHSRDSFLYGVPGFSEGNKPTRLFPASVFLLEIELHKVQRLPDAGDKGIPVFFKPGRAVLLYYRDTCAIKAGDKFVVNPEGSPELVENIDDRKEAQRKKDQTDRNSKDTILFTI